MLDAQERQRWAEADRARLHWALYLHGDGRCDEAVAALLENHGADGRPGAVAAQILCLRLLGWCCRQDEAGRLWAAIERSTTPKVRWVALSELRHPSNVLLEEADARTHELVCAYHR